MCVRTEKVSVVHQFEMAVDALDFERASARAPASGRADTVSSVACALSSNDGRPASDRAAPPSATRASGVSVVRFKVGFQPLQPSVEVAGLDRPNQCVDDLCDLGRLARRDGTIGNGPGDRGHRGCDIGRVRDRRQIELHVARGAARRCAQGRAASPSGHRRGRVPRPSGSAPRLRRRAATRPRATRGSGTRVVCRPDCRIGPSRKAAPAPVLAVFAAWIQPWVGLLSSKFMAPWSARARPARPRRLGAN